MFKKKEFKLKQSGERSLVYDRNELFTARKKALIQRDPNMKEFLGKLLSYNAQTGKPTGSKIQSLKLNIEKKWNVTIVVTWAARPHLYGVDPTKNLRDDPFSPLKMKLSENKEVEIAPLIILNRTKSSLISSLPIYPFEYLLPISPLDGKITIQIDLDLVNQNDAHAIKKAVWQIIKEHLKGRKGKIPREPKELNFLYHCRQNTFDNYVRWYDLHTHEKLGFRPIAAWDKTQKTNPKRAEQVLERLTHDKTKCHGPIRGEDNIERGIKVIYKAIHRKEYSRKDLEPIDEKYDCSHHGTNCPTSCMYYKNWLGRFNRLNPI